LPDLMNRPITMRRTRTHACPLSERDRSFFGVSVEWHLDFHNAFSHEEFHFAAWDH
jgi:hypothetical protein